VEEGPREGSKSALGGLGGGDEGAWVGAEDAGACSSGGAATLLSREASGGGWLW
jgi:hypothetical protein